MKLYNGTGGPDESDYPNGGTISKDCRPPANEPFVFYTNPDLNLQHDFALVHRTPDMTQGIFPAKEILGLVVS